MKINISKQGNNVYLVGEHYEARLEYEFTRAARTVTVYMGGELQLIAQSDGDEIFKTVFSATLQEVKWYEYARQGIKPRRLK